MSSGSSADVSAEGISLPKMIKFPYGADAEIEVAKYEVTYGQWQECVDAGACSHTPKRWHFTRIDHPVSGVSWLDVQQYISWVSQVTGDTYRLPLESEWRAFAGDILQDKSEKLFDDPRMAWAADYINYGKRSERRTQPIGHHGEAANGIADLSGNVWEWTETCWRRASSTKPERTRDCGGARVLAGQHMTYQSELIRKVPTGGCSIGFPPANIGFRLVKGATNNLALLQHNPSDGRG
ncbi:MAG: formylglycine-generating enzyme family protein [Marinovum sp.]|nr:formylglycine-generating enzyme family protein [Marinovum sp.]